jgi:hypothetical protein
MKLPSNPLTEITEIPIDAPSIEREHPPTSIDRKFHLEGVTVSLFTLN